MTELYINSQRVTLPNDIKWKCIKQNPFITKNGTYTYDITLSLRDKNNAKVYGHINRKNFSEKIPESRTALLIVDNRVELNGTEIILEKTESEVSIQLVSGNSELNYISGSDLKIRSLDLGFEPMYLAEINETWIKDKMDNPDEHLLFPVMDPDSDMMLNRWDAIWNHVEGAQYGVKMAYMYDGVTQVKDSNGDAGVYFNMRPQPALYFILERILETLGYIIAENQLRNHLPFSNLYIIHGYNTVLWAKMLPNWTVSEFITQVEYFSGCTVIVDNIKKQVRIVFPKEIEFVKREVIVVDEYSDNIDVDRSISSFQNKNIGYSLGSDSYTKYAHINREIIDKSEIVDLRNSDESILEQLSNLFYLVNDTTDDFRKTKIYRTDFGDWIAYSDGSKTYPLEVNHLHPIYNNSNDTDDIDLTIKIIPASMRVVKRELLTASLPHAGMGFYYIVQIPISEYFDDIEAKYNGADFISIQDKIGSSSSENTSDTLRVTQFDGRKNVAGTSTPYEPYPMCFVRGVAEFFTDINTRQLLLETGENRLNLKWLFENYLSKCIKIDETQEHEFYILSDRDMLPSDIYLIENREYVCSQLEYDIDTNGFSKICKGIFYPIIQ
jgi:hypothetical protein